MYYNTRFFDKLYFFFWINILMHNLIKCTKRTVVWYKEEVLIKFQMCTSST